MAFMGIGKDCRKMDREEVNSYKNESDDSGEEGKESECVMCRWIVNLGMILVKRE